MITKIGLTKLGMVAAIGATLTGYSTPAAAYRGPVFRGRAGAPFARAPIYRAPVFRGAGYGYAAPVYAPVYAPPLRFAPHFRHYRRW